MRKKVAGLRLLCLSLFLLTGVLSRAAQGGSTYSETTTDFRRFLQEIVDASESGDEKRIESLLKSTEVPNCIGADGAVYNTHALSGEGLSEDPSLRKAAEEAVLQWRYKPATMDGKPILTNAVTVDLVFAPKN